MRHEAAAQAGDGDLEAVFVLECRTKICYEKRRSLSRLSVSQTSSSSPDVHFVSTRTHIIQSSLFSLPTSSVNQRESHFSRRFICLLPVRMTAADASGASRSLLWRSEAA